MTDDDDNNNNNTNNNNNNGSGTINMYAENKKVDHRSSSLISL
jgi:hypothetical protein